MEKLQKRISKFLQNKFNIIPKKSQLIYHEKKDWERYCLARDLNQSSEGFYCLRDLSAHILTDSEFLLQNLFHEFFGHGLYFEHSINGKEAHSLEQKLREEEKQCKSLNEIKRLRQNNPLYNQILKLQEQDFNQTEGFAMWMELYLSALTKNISGFEKRYEQLANSRKMILDKFIDYGKALGEHAVLFSCGFPKFYDNKILESLLKNIFKQDFESIKFALLYGSRKPYSDIDLFIVSDKIKSNNFGWMDVYSIGKNHFEDLASKLDISVTDALFTGDLILGDKGYLEKIKKRILFSPITPNAIKFHKKHSEKAKILASQCFNSLEHYRSAMQFNESYLKNAFELEKGHKPLTLKKLKSIYPEVFKKFDKKAYKIQAIREA